ncbi:MAG TPA: malto-oligosyltrehalose synthase, partial [Chitinophagaceae bacterium]
FQFHKEFSFADFEKVIPYLKKLGVTTVYASPIFEAVPGSNHGYDGTNPNVINPEVGTLEELRSLGRTLRGEGIGWLQDIVPNHMAFHPRNRWLMDVLEKGQQSRYAAFFDVAWNHPEAEGRLMVPFLGSDLEEVIAKGELTVAYEGGRFVFRYFDSSFPLNPDAYATILEQGDPAGVAAIGQWLEQCKELKYTDDPAAFSEGWEELLKQLVSLRRTEKVGNYITSCLEKVSANKDLLLRISEDQRYRLCSWQETDYRINYRRFFTVNGLICVNIQDEKVFGHYHELINQLTAEGVFKGLRIDHIDGLYDPAGYLVDLRNAVGEEVYITVEKILAPEEELPETWPIEGNTGYDFLAIVNNLLTSKMAEAAFTQYYYNWINDHRTVSQQVRDKKSYILNEHMGGELDNLYRLFLEQSLVEEERVKAMEPDILKRAIGAFLIHCPVYRFYGGILPLVNEEMAAVQDILSRVRQSEPELGEAVALLEDALLRKPLEGAAEYNLRAAHFYKRCMQFSGPLMAKGVEDTLMYTFQRFIAHNEVGDAPDAFGYTPGEFHQRMARRQERWPLSLNATSTHDTKRGEDVRARLNVLTDLPELWLKTVEEWRQLNAPLKEGGAPDLNDEYFIYQTLVGSYPLVESEEAAYGGRLKEYLQKALREAKRHSNWTSPNERYESAVARFAEGLLRKGTPFWKSFGRLLKRIAPHGVVNSLAQVVLKFTCPGVPDVYQGCELWDLSLVDPDNRRPVDYARRLSLLEALEERTADKRLFGELWKQAPDGRIKLWLVQRLLQLRREQEDLFTAGDYIPLAVEGTCKDHVFAFARKYKRKWLIVALPLHTAALAGDQKKDPLGIDWKDTRIQLPRPLKGEYVNLLGGPPAKVERGIPVKELFRPLPLALLSMEAEENARGAGVLLHITSLPSPFGIGDMGPEARKFADFLHRSKQRYWQLLPINPTEEGQGHSPYSATSSRAGNTLLISPYGLAQDGLLRREELLPLHLPYTDRVDYRGAEQIKQQLYGTAWQRFRDGAGGVMQDEFTAFVNKESEWLPDYTLYTLLKKKFGGQPWYEWPEEYKLKDEAALQALEAEHADEAGKIRWLQFIFSRQWHGLRDYCNKRGIELVGDLPFYVSYDSADVWSHRSLFNLDEEGAVVGMAGVPPDAFSDDGQLWGMPVFRWNVLKERRYDWWVQRLRKNVELFDLVRLDHFRAFAGYWEVPAGEQTAINGEWKVGPGDDFFRVVREELGSLPFIAEDLGDIDQPVLDLRDDFALPGMKILQFAFGDDYARSDYIPHNYATNFLVYTGTHDNNTTKGWWRQEADEATRNRVMHYTGRSIGEDDIVRVLAQLAYSSVARIVILPLQDVLGLDEGGRMNTPASSGGNWGWRFLPGQVVPAAEEQLRQWTILYNRI